MTARTIKTLLVVAALSATTLITPALAEPGSWMAYSGVPEPNTQWDADARRMFQTPNADAEDRVYFNGMLMSDAFQRYDVQLEGGSFVSPAAARFAAALGYWRDCNGDGYIGMRAAPASYGSFSVYAAALADIDTDVCPAGSPYWPTNSVTGQPNGVVDEFRWIGQMASYTPTPSSGAPVCVLPSRNPEIICVQPSVDTRVTKDRYDVADGLAKVWADWGYPGSPHLLTQGITMTADSSKDSDSTLHYVDAALQFILSDTTGAFWTSKPNIGACDDEPTFLGGPDDTCGLWAVHQAWRLVNDSRTTEGDGAHPQPLVTVFDVNEDDDGDGNPCNDGLNQQVAGRTVGFADVEPGYNQNLLVEGSVVGTLSNVNRASNTYQFDGRCAPGGVRIGGQGDGAVAETTHRQPAEELGFVPDQRYHVLDAYGFEEIPADLAGTRGTPQGLFGVPIWVGGTTWTMRPPRAGFGSLTDVHATWYADVSPEAFANNTNARVAAALPAGTQDAHTYGVEFCDGFTIGPSNVDPDTSWECSITVWEDKRVEDQRHQNTQAAAARAIIGDKYDLRDVDCYDNSVSSHNSVVGGALYGVRLGLGACAPVS